MAPFETQLIHDIKSKRNLNNSGTLWNALKRLYFFIGSDFLFSITCFSTVIEKQNSFIVKQHWTKFVLAEASAMWITESTVYFLSNQAAQLFWTAIAWDNDIWDMTHQCLCSRFSCVTSWFVFYWGLRLNWRKLWFPPCLW